jgi:hypothetical protein
MYTDNEEREKGADVDAVSASAGFIDREAKAGRPKGTTLMGSISHSHHNLACFLCSFSLGVLQAPGYDWLEVARHLEALRSDDAQRCSCAATLGAFVYRPSIHRKHGFV